MKIAIITAGGAGMFCGSCMQDNTVARALRLAGEDVVLIPTYTPIRVDEENVSANRVFMGGINVYLDSAVPGWHLLPGWMTSWLNHPATVRWLTRFGSDPDPSKLGKLTLDMLNGAAGPQQRELRTLVSYLCGDLQPDVILFSNSLLSGVLSELRPKFPGKIICLLQGDDIFLEALDNRWKRPVMEQLRRNCTLFDGFLTHSGYYRDFMADYLKLDGNRIRQIPLTIDTDECPGPADVAHAECRGVPADETFRIGYFARICPEKGVQNLLEAACTVLPHVPGARVDIAGYLPPRHRQWFERYLREAREKVPHRIHWLGSPDTRTEKLQIISRFNLLCVPTEYHEPKGLFVLEAGLVGVPVLLPRHGVFPELAEKLKHGMLYDPTSKTGLSDALRTAIEQYPSKPRDLPARVRDQFGMQATGPLLRQALAACLAG